MISFRDHGEENRIFKATMTVLLFFFNLLHWSCFVSLSQGLPHIDALRMESEIELNSVAGKINSIIPMNHNLHQVANKKFLRWMTSDDFKHDFKSIFDDRFIFSGISRHFHGFKIALHLIINVLQKINISTRCGHFQFLVLHSRWQFSLCFLSRIDRFL